MNPYAVYDAVLPVLRGGARVAALFRPKVRAGLEGRRGLEARLADFGRGSGGRCVWMHSTSVGEYEQARPIAALLRERRPDIPILHTFFSPSGYVYATRRGEAEHVAYLPEDTRAQAGAALDAVRPRALVLLKFDVWPNLVREARVRGIPVLLFDATLRPASWRSRGAAASLYREVYARIDLISAASEADAARFRALVPQHQAIVVDGDTRYDQVVRRRRAAGAVALPASLVATPRPFTLLAGSTWPADEERLVPAWAAFAGRRAARLVVAPHEPTPKHLEGLERRLRTAGLESVRYAELEAGKPAGSAVVLLDRVGILAELYAVADAAYVGGGFGTGVHNLLEPAILGLPLLHGPRHANAPEAGAFLDAGASRVIASSADLGREIALLSADGEARRARGATARASVEANLGASERCYAHLERFLAASPSRAEVPPR